MARKKKIVSQDSGKSIEEATKAIVPLNTSEELLLSKWREKAKSAQIPIFFQNGKEGLELDVCGNRGSRDDRNNLLMASIYQFTGATDSIFALSLIKQYACVAAANEKNFDTVTESNAYINTMNSLSPQDEVEGMLLTQILSLQVLGMKCMSRASNPENSTINVDRNVNNLTKLLRLQHETIETLNRHRRKGTQQMIVQHVNVNQGGQAIVGAVQQGGGGGNCKNEGSTP